jgi:hypothetical protein
VVQGCCATHRPALQNGFAGSVHSASDVQPLTSSVVVSPVPESVTTTPSAGGFTGGWQANAKPITNTPSNSVTDNFICCIASSINNIKNKQTTGSNFMILL